MVLGGVMYWERESVIGLLLVLCEDWGVVEMCSGQNG